MQQKPLLTLTQNLYAKSDANSNAIGLASAYIPVGDIHHLFYYNAHNKLANLHYSGSGPINDTTVQFRDGESGVTIAGDVEGARPIAAVPFGWPSDRVDSVSLTCSRLELSLCPG